MPRSPMRAAWKQMHKRICRHKKACSRRSALRNCGQTIRSRWQRKVGKFLERAAYTSYNGDSIADATEHLSLKKDVLGCKVIQLPKKEYAHVMSELETWMTDEERKNIVVSKNIGKYNYTFVFDGTSYKCIKKILLK